MLSLEISGSKPSPYEGGVFSSQESAIVDAGREAWRSLRKSFDHWVTIGHAIKVLREKADRDGRKAAFKHLMKQQGFSMEGKAEEGRVLQKSRVTRLLHIMDNLEDVQAWHVGLSPFQQYEWASPDAVYRHCPVFNPDTPEVDPADKPLTPMQQLKKELVLAEEEIARLKDRGEGDISFTRKDRIVDVAILIVSSLGETKVRSLIKALNARLKEVEAEFANKEPG